MSLKQIFILALLMLVPLFSLPAKAATLDDDELEDGAQQCLEVMPAEEQRYHMPAHLLEAIATVEAGQRKTNSKIPMPWPWTINAYGRGYYFHSKEEAVAKARTFQKRHVRNMAVGCMQINISANKQAFDSLEEAFDPTENVALAASMLNDAYEDEGSWRKAVAAYHTGDSDTGNAYAAKIFRMRAKLMPLKLKNHSAKQTTPPIADSNDE